jgi:hypothetical protein
LADTRSGGSPPWPRAPRKRRREHEACGAGHFKACGCSAGDWSRCSRSLRNDPPVPPSNASRIGTVAACPSDRWSYAAPRRPDRRPAPSATSPVAVNRYRHERRM